MNNLYIDRVSLRLHGSRLFDPLDLVVEAGHVGVVTGPSGAGKSSLLAAICGVLPSELRVEGSLRLGDTQLDALPPESREVGILFQETLLFPHLDVQGNLMFGLRGDESRRTRRQWVEQQLARVGLDGFGRRDPATLSGGQKARVAMLRVLLSEPRLLLLDEPFSGLDRTTHDSMRQLVASEARRRGIPVVLVTHDAADIQAANGPVVILAPGEALGEESGAG